MNPKNATDTAAFSKTAKAAAILRKVRSLGALAALMVPGTSYSASLKPETLKTWDAYVAAASAQMQRRLSPDNPFLLTDDECPRLRSGETLVFPVGPDMPRKIPSGLIHHWVGATFVPNTTLPAVLSIVRDYERYGEIYHPAVIVSSATSTSEAEDRFSMVLMNKSAISKTALEGDYRASYFRVDDQRAYSFAETVRVQEIAAYGTAGQHRLPENQGTGLIWRLFSITRFEARDGGVYIEIEAIALSRDVPVALRLMVDPLIRRVSRESLKLSLQQTREAVQTVSDIARREGITGQRALSVACASDASWGAGHSFTNLPARKSY